MKLRTWNFDTTKPFRSLCTCAALALFISAPLTAALMLVSSIPFLVGESQAGPVVTLAYVGLSFLMAAFTLPFMLTLIFSLVPFKALFPLAGAALSFPLIRHGRIKKQPLLWIWVALWLITFFAGILSGKISV